MIDDKNTNKKFVRPTREEAMEAVKTMLAWAGDDPTREGLLETPKRVVKAYEEFFSGYNMDPDEILNKTFAPSLEEKELYISQIKAFEEAIIQGKGVAVLDGKIVENLHVEIAKRNLGLMTAIEELK